MKFISLDFKIFVYALFHLVIYQILNKEMQ